MSEETPNTPAPAQTFSADYVRELRAENKGLRLKATEMEQRATTAEAAARTADERVAAAKAEADAAIAAANTAAETKVADATKAAADGANERVIRAELRTAATAAGMKDLDGLKLADLSSVKLNDKGEVEGADALMASLKETKAYLFGEPPKTATTSTTPPPNPAPTTGKKASDWTDAEMAIAEKAVKEGKPVPTF